MKRYDFGYNIAILSSVEVLDSGFLLSGVIAEFSPSIDIGTFLAKTDLKGNLVFFKPLLSEERSYQTWKNTLRVAKDYYYNVGFSTDSIEYSTILIKYDTAGDTVFVRRIPLVYKDSNNVDTTIPYDLEIDFDNNLVLLDNQRNPETNLTEAIITKIDTEGNILWQHIVGDPNFHIRSHDIIPNGGDYLLAAGKGNIGIAWKDFHETSLILRLDSLGNQTKIYGSPKNQREINSFFKTNSGEIICLANKGYEVKQPLGQQSFFFDWMYVFKINNNNTFEWGVHFNDSLESIVNTAIKVIPSIDKDGYVAIGRNINVHSPSTLSGILTKVSNKGDSLWLRQYNFLENHGGNIFDRFLDIEESNDNGYIIVGETTDNTTSVNQYGWLLKVDKHGCLIPGCQISSQVKNTQSENPLELKIFPNPTSDFLNFSVELFNSNKKFDVRIIGITGKVAFKANNLSQIQTNILSLNNWSEGVYILQIISENQIISSQNFSVTK